MNFMLACSDTLHQTVDTFAVNAASFSSLAQSTGLDSKHLVLMGLFTGWIPVAIVAIIADHVSKVSRTKAREQTKREVAAYIAEGSMTPEQGERILNAGPESKKKWC